MGIPKHARSAHSQHVKNCYRHVKISMHGEWTAISGCGSIRRKNQLENSYRNSLYS